MLTYEMDRNEAYRWFYKDDLAFVDELKTKLSLQARKLGLQGVEIYDNENHLVEEWELTEPSHDEQILALAEFLDSNLDPTKRDWLTGEYQKTLTDPSIETKIRRLLNHGLAKDRWTLDALKKKLGLES